MDTPDKIATGLEAGSDMVKAAEEAGLIKEGQKGSEIMSVSAKLARSIGSLANLFKRKKS